MEIHEIVTRAAGLQVLFAHFWATVCKTVRPMLSLSDRCLSICSISALWPSGWMD